MPSTAREIMPIRDVFPFFLLISLIFWANKSHSTQFLPSSIDDQLVNSSAIIWGYYNDEVYKRLPTGQVVTEASFSIVKFAGIKNDETFNRNAFKVLFFGGVWEDVVHDVSGAPKFRPNEEVVLLLRKDGHGHWITNLSLGKYSVHKDFEGTYIKSVVFPDHPQLGRITLFDLENSVRGRFSDDLHFANEKEEIFVNSSTNFETKPKLQKGAQPNRQPSSFGNSETENSDNQISMFWLMVILSLLGMFSSYIIKLKR